MLYYPQLLTGSVAQYPITRSNLRRTVVNALADGTQITMPDPGAAAVHWALTYAHLTSGELAGLQELFASTSGRWQTFTFLDPTDNLLNWSEDLSQPDWHTDPLVALSGGFADALGGTSAWRLVNSAQATQSLVQTLPIAPSYQYCFSAYVRADVAGSFMVIADSVQWPTAAGTSWTRIVVPFQSNSSASPVSVGVSLPPGGSIYVFGAQLEAQAAAGGYKKTRDIAGVYPYSRFDQDELTVAATGLGQFGTVVRIVSNVAG